MSDFRISAALEGHSEDVRAVVFPNSNTVLSASRDATVRIWKLQSSSPPVFDYRISFHGSSFVNALAFLSPTQEFPEGLIFSGGQDAIIEARQLGISVDDAADGLLVGHSHNVCAIDVSMEGSWIVSGSWDSSARVWKIGKWECETTLEGHQGSVWAVLAYDKDTVITGCADQLIRVFDVSGRLKNTIRGSAGVVRALCKLPMNHASGAHFVSAGNDSIIRFWTLQGRQTAELHGHESFIYSLASLPSGELVSSGEDRTVRIWNTSGCIQTITHPAISVWSVAACQETGDIVTGASDRIARVFTRDSNRQADMELISKFNDSVKGSSIPQQQIGSISKEKLPGPEFLSQKLGTKEGQVQMIREDNGNVSAHTWSVGTQQWINVGTVVDSVGTGGKKVEYLGQDYDYVFDVDIEDGKPPLKLPYNLSENPYTVATRFIQENQLPVSYLEQVANFIITNTQGAQVSAESTNNEPVPMPTVPSGPSKVLPQKTYLSIKTANLRVIQKKVGEINTQLISDGHKDLSLPPSDLEIVTSFCDELSKSSPLQDSPGVEIGLKLIMKIATTWPDAKRLPGIDLLRLLAAATPLTATSTYGGKNLVHALLISGVFEAPLNINNAMLTIRVFANLFETTAGRDLVSSHFDEIMACVSSVISNENTLNRNLTIAAATLYINMAVFLTFSDKVATSPDSAERGLHLLDVIKTIISKEKDSEAIYRGLVALGTLVMRLGEEVRSAAKDIYDANATLSRIESVGLTREPRIKAVVAEIKSSLR